MMSSQITDAVGLLLNVVRRLFPIVQDEAVITSRPDYDDTTRALLPRLRERGFKVTLLTSDASPPPQWARSARMLHKWSLRGLVAFSRARQVYFTHGLYPKQTRRRGQVIVNVWHGMPIKKIGKLLHPDERIAKADHLVATSEHFVPILSKAFAIPQEDVLLTGLPRNDILLTAPRVLKGLKRYVVWLPTYRKSEVGSKRVDSEMDTTASGIMGIPLEDLNQALAARELRCVIKLHPMEKAKIRSGACEWVEFVDDDGLLKREASLYELLSGSEALLTDGSSVLIDYMLTRRPIIVYFPDIQAYEDSRGFTFDFKTLGLPVLTRKAELLSALANIEMYTYSDDVVRAMHKHQHGFAERLVDEIARYEPTG